MEVNFYKMESKTMNLLDIIGPIMIGPSSSHTAGAVRLGLLARKILGQQPTTANIDLYGSFAQTYKGHGTDLALIAGLLGYLPDDERIPSAFDIANKAGLNYSFDCKPTDEFIHPNTAIFNLQALDGQTCKVGGASLGGGRVLINNINDFQVDINGELSALVTLHSDKQGIIANVTNILSSLNINIANMQVFRHQKGGTAVMIIQTDQELEQKIVPIINSQPNIKSARIINKIS